MMTLHELYTKFASDDDEAATAHAVLAHLGVRGDAARLLQNLVADDVRRFWRGVVAEIERATRSPTPLATATGCSMPASGAGGTSEPTHPLLRADLLAARFAVGDGRFVLWGEATVADHEARIVFLGKLQSGIGATIDRHRSAIGLIASKRRAKCLNDLAGHVAA